MALCFVSESTTKDGQANLLIFVLCSITNPKFQLLLLIISAESVIIVVFFLLLIYSDWFILGCGLLLVSVPIKCAFIMNFVNFYEIILEIEFVERYSSHLIISICAIYGTEH